MNAMNIDDVFKKGAQVAATYRKNSLDNRTQQKTDDTQAWDQQHTKKSDETADALKKSEAVLASGVKKGVVLTKDELAKENALHISLMKQQIGLG